MLASPMVIEKAKAAALAREGASVAISTLRLAWIGVAPRLRAASFLLLSRAAKAEETDRATKGQAIEVCARIISTAPPRLRRALQPEAIRAGERARGRAVIHPPRPERLPP